MFFVKLTSPFEAMWLALVVYGIVNHSVQPETVELTISTKDSKTLKTLPAIKVFPVTFG